MHILCSTWRECGPLQMNLYIILNHLFLRHSFLLCIKHLCYIHLCMFRKCVSLYICSPTVDRGHPIIHNWIRFLLHSITLTRTRVWLYETLCKDAKEAFDRTSVLLPPVDGKRTIQGNSPVAPPGDRHHQVHVAFRSPSRTTR